MPAQTPNTHLQLGRIHHFLEVASAVRLELHTQTHFFTQQWRSQAIAHIQRKRWSSLQKSIQKRARAIKEQGQRLDLLRAQLESCRSQLLWSNTPASLAQAASPTLQQAFQKRLSALFALKKLPQEHAARILARSRDARPLLDWQAQHMKLEQSLQKNGLKQLRHAAMLDHLHAVTRLQLIPGSELPASDTLEQEAQNAQDFLQLAYTRLGDLLQNAAYFQLAEAARQLRSTTASMLTQTLLPRCAALQTQDLQAQGRVLLSWSSLSREFLLMLSVCRLVEMHANWPTVSTQGFFAAAKKLKRGSHMKLPKAIAISSLNKQPQRYHQQELSVLGIVHSIGIKHVGKKAVSFIRLNSLDGKHSLALELHGIKIDSGGLIVGCIAQIGGVWLDDEKGQRLMIGRYTLRELARTHLNDYLRYACTPVYETIAHGLMLEMNFASGTTGAVNPVLYGVWSRGEA